MTDENPQFLNLSHDRKIAYLTNINPQNTPSGILWANGFRSNMTGIKASSVSQWATKQSLSCVRFDYSGNGASSGCFEEGTIGDWVEECAAIFDQITHGSQILVGSSMGGWIVLLVTLAHIKQVGVKNSRIKGLVLIAPAVDMTQDLMWQKFPAGIRQGLEETGVFMRPSAYEDGTYPITHKLIEEGRKHLLFGGDKFNTHCPIRIIHGRKDVDVPWQQSEKLIAHLANEDVRLDMVEDGEHRLSRDQDIKRLIAVISERIPSR
jgi:pimeloyl-ACP methyl ester carboxylesterase